MEGGGGGGEFTKASYLKCPVRPGRLYFTMKHALKNNVNGRNFISGFENH